MAKKDRIRLIGLGLVALVILTGVVTKFAWLQADVKAVGTKTDINKNEGCLPARANVTNITRIDTRLEAIQTQQKTNFEEILRRLPKNERTTTETNTGIARHD